jgi:hypothetical protein
MKKAPPVKEGLYLQKVTITCSYGIVGAEQEPC